MQSAAVDSSFLHDVLTATLGAVNHFQTNGECMLPRVLNGLNPQYQQGRHKLMILGAQVS